jgi:hypothetical protein
MPPNKQTLKDLFIDDPETLRIFEIREQNDILKKILDRRIYVDGLEKVKGEKGDKGMTPIKGIDYFTSDEINHIVNYIKQIVKEEVKPIKGKDYFDGIDGRNGIDGKDGINGKDGKDISKKELKAIISDLLYELDGKKPKQDIEGLHQYSY